jgi:uncharacterized protein YjlB
MRHPSLPVLLYRQAVPPDAEAIQKRFAEHGWGGAWQGSVFPFPHYHSNVHEALAVVHGHATIRLGGDGGIELELRTGDAVVLPAGTGHELLQGSEDFVVIGAYPRDRQDWDLRRDPPDEETRERIRSVPIPAADPVFGAGGHLVEHWRQGPRPAPGT